MFTFGCDSWKDFTDNSARFLVYRFVLKQDFKREN
jgi:hypothetical protein